VDKVEEEIVIVSRPVLATGSNLVKRTIRFTTFAKYLIEEIPFLILSSTDFVTFFGSDWPGSMFIVISKCPSCYRSYSLVNF
jgi:hypothetical protein